MSAGVAEGQGGATWRALSHVLPPSLPLSLPPSLTHTHAYLLRLCRRPRLTAPHTPSIPHTLPSSHTHTRTYLLRVWRRPRLTAPHR